MFDHFLFVRVRASMKSSSYKKNEGFLMSTFSERLKAARQARGFTQRELAERLNLTRGAVALWESDRESGTQPRNMDLLAELAKVLRVPLLWLTSTEAKPEEAWTFSSVSDRAEHHAQISQEARARYERLRSRYEPAEMRSVRVDNHGAVRVSRGILDALPPPEDVLPDLEQDGHLFVFAQTAQQIEHKMQTLKNASDNVQKHLVLIGCEGKVSCAKDPAEALSQVVQFLRKV